MSRCLPNKLQPTPAGLRRYSFSMPLASRPGSRTAEGVSRRTRSADDKRAPPVRDEENMPSHRLINSDITQPSPLYKRLVLKPSERLPAHPSRRPPPLLILDLNGSLLYRNKRSRGTIGASRRPELRPHLQEFLDYIFSYDHSYLPDIVPRWEVMIWSSAQPTNVAAMCEAIGVRKRPNSRFQSTTADSSDKKPAWEALDIWDRLSLNLRPEDYDRKVQTVKDLDRVWRALSWKDPLTGRTRCWGPRNTLIIDDDPQKLILQPQNLLLIPEYTGRRGPEDHTLRDIIPVLDSLRFQSNIAAALQEHLSPRISPRKVVPEPSKLRAWS